MNTEPKEKNKPKKNKRTGIRTFNAGLSDASRRVYRFVRDGAVGRYLSGYDGVCERYEAVLTGKRLKRRKKRTSEAEKNDALVADTDREFTEEMDGTVGFNDPETLPTTFTDRCAQMFDSSRIIHWITRLKDAILRTPIVTCGVLAFAFSLFLLISQSAVLLFSVYNVRLPLFGTPSESDTVLTVAFMAAAVVLMPVSLTLIFAKENSLYGLMVDSRISGFVLKNLMGLQENPALRNPRARNNGRSFILGMFFGLLTFLVRPYYLLVFLVFLLLAVSVLSAPESGLYLLLFSLPFRSALSGYASFVRILMGLLLFSTGLKLMRGKRRMKMEPVDFLVFLFLALLLFGGIITYGGIASFADAVQMLLFGCVYFVAVALIRSEKRLVCCLSALQWAALITAFWYGLDWLLQRYSDGSGKWISFGTLPFSENSGALSVFLTIVFLASFGLLCARVSLPVRIQSAATMAAVILNLIVADHWLLSLLLFGAVLFFGLIRTPKAVFPSVFVVITVVVLVLCLPDSVTTSLFSRFRVPDEVLYYRENIWAVGSQMAKKYFLPGIGIGGSAFSTVFSRFSTGTIATPNDVGNLYFQILLSLGLGGLLLFMALLVMMVRSISSFFHRCGVSGIFQETALSLLCAMVALLFLGGWFYLWNDLRSFFLFCLVLGLLTACRRLGIQNSAEKREEFDAYDLDLVLVRRREKTAVKKAIPADKSTMDEDFSK